MPPLPPLEDEDDDASLARDSIPAARMHNLGIDPEGIARGPLVVLPIKSVGISMMLTFLFGPLGMLYSTVAGGTCMVLLGMSLGAFTFCAGGLTAGAGFLVLLPVWILFWIVCVIWGAAATNSFNKKLRQGRY
jgi:hypothetical protein